MIGVVPSPGTCDLVRKFCSTPHHSFLHRAGEMLLLGSPESTSTVLVVFLLFAVLDVDSNSKVVTVLVVFLLHALTLNLVKNF